MRALEKLDDFFLKLLADGTILSWKDLTDFINSSSEGIKTNVGEKSNKISGGQNQRIGIARALLKEKEILIFDEATNSLDYKVEQKILENIKKLKKNKIIFLISHKEKNFEICDEVLSISNN